MLVPEQQSAHGHGVADLRDEFDRHAPCVLEVEQAGRVDREEGVPAGIGALPADPVAVGHRTLGDGDGIGVEPPRRVAGGPPPVTGELPQQDSGVEELADPDDEGEEHHRARQGDGHGCQGARPRFVTVLAEGDAQRDEQRVREGRDERSERPLDDAVALQQGCQAHRHRRDAQAHRRGQCGEGQTGEGDHGPGDDPEEGGDAAGVEIRVRGEDVRQAAVDERCEQADDDGDDEEPERQTPHRRRSDVAEHSPPFPADRDALPLRRVRAGRSVRVRPGLRHRRPPSFVTTRA